MNQEAEEAVAYATKVLSNVLRSGQEGSDLNNVRGTAHELVQHLWTLRERQARREGTELSARLAETSVDQAKRQIQGERRAISHYARELAATLSDLHSNGASYDRRWLNVTAAGGFEAVEAILLADAVRYGQGEK